MFLVHKLKNKIEICQIFNFDTFWFQTKKMNEYNYSNLIALNYFDVSNMFLNNI